MKRLWNILSVLAIANLLAMAGFVLWLKASDRLSVDRLRQVRAMLAPTLADDAKAKADADAAQAADEKKKAEEARQSGVPESSEERIARQKETDDAAVQTVLRARREIDDLRRRLMEDRDALDKERTALAADQQRWAKQRQEEATQTQSKQFKQALATLESQKPKDAQQLLKLMVGAQQRAQAVAYLSQMQERPRSKIMSEFVKDDAKLAADLLEELRIKSAESGPRDGGALAKGGTPSQGQGGGGPEPAGGGVPGSSPSSKPPGSPSK